MRSPLAPGPLRHRLLCATTILKIENLFPEFERSPWRQKAAPQHFGTTCWMSSSEAWHRNCSRSWPTKKVRKVFLHGREVAMMYLFDDYTLHTELYELRYAGAPCPLEPQVLDILLYLIQHRDRVVTREELWSMSGQSASSVRPRWTTGLWKPVRPLVTADNGNVALKPYVVGLPLCGQRGGASGGRAPGRSRHSAAATGACNGARVC